MTDLEEIKQKMGMKEQTEEEIDNQCLKELEPMYYFINLSSQEEYEEYATRLRNKIGVEYCDIYSYPQNLCSPETIQVYDVLPYTFMNVDVPIIYFVDEMSLLNNNDIWVKMRNTHKDLVLDCHERLESFNDVLNGRN